MMMIKMGIISLQFSLVAAIGNIATKQLFLF